jgi:hypothetical protein
MGLSNEIGGVGYLESSHLFSQPVCDPRLFRDRVLMHSKEIYLIRFFQVQLIHQQLTCSALYSMKGVNGNARPHRFTKLGHIKGQLIQSSFDIVVSFPSIFKYPQMDRAVFVRKLAHLQFENNSHAPNIPRLVFRFGQQKGENNYEASEQDGATELESHREVFEIVRAESNLGKWNFPADIERKHHVKLLPTR